MTITLNTEAGDHGGVHINSGIPNKAFYLAAMGMSCYAWERPGHIWYELLKASNPDTQFQDFADTTYAKAGALYGSAEQQAVLSAWRDVGIRVSGAPTMVPAGPRPWMKGMWTKVRDGKTLYKATNGAYGTRGTHSRLSGSSDEYISAELSRRLDEYF